MPAGAQMAGPTSLLLLLFHHALLLAACHAALSSTGGTWAVIVSSSRYWHNYRHTSNALVVYQAVKRLGIPDNNIVLMLADVPACNPRNLHPGMMFSDPGALGSNLFREATQVDYVGRETNVESLLRVLTGRHHPATPLSKRLRSDARSNVLLYLTGHGGDEFLKFHDNEELLAADLGNALMLMHMAGRYRQLMLLVDTCQAATLFNKIKAPNVMGVASSQLGESSYAHYVDMDIGLHLSDQFTSHLASFLGPLGPNSSATLQQLVEHAQAKGMASTLVPWASSGSRRGLREVGVMEFFSGGGNTGAGVAAGGVGLRGGGPGGGELQQAQQGGGPGAGALFQGEIGAGGGQGELGCRCRQQPPARATGAQLYSVLLDAPFL